MIRLVDGLIAPFLGFLADWSIRWGILILGLGVGLRLSPPRRAATRHWLCATVLGAGLALPLAPIWTAPWPRYQTRTETARATPVRVSLPAAEPSGWVGEATGAPAAIAPSPAGGVSNVVPPGRTTPPMEPPALQASPGKRWGWVRLGWLVLGGVWLAGTTGSLVRLMVGRTLLARVRRAARPLTGPSRLVFEAARREAALEPRRVEAASHGGIGSPVVIGGRTPVVLVPADWDHWPAATQRACLLHELAHLGRRDDRWKLGAELALAPFWFHPAVRWLAARLDHEAELACDEATVAGGVAPVALAHLLLDCARRPHRLDPRAFVIGRQALSFFERATVATRITRLLEDDMPRSLIRPAKWQVFALTGTVASLALAIGGARVGAIEPPNRPAPLATRSTPPEPPAAAPQDFAPAPGGGVLLTVRDAEGRAVEGATVLLRSRAGDRGNTYQTRATARTNTAGLVRFDQPAAPGDLVLAFKEGFCYVFQPFVDRAGKPVSQLTLPPARTLAGVVRDNAGQPVADAEVRVFMTGGRAGNQTNLGNASIPVAGTPLEAVLLTRSDAQGQFQFTLLPDQPEVQLKVAARGMGKTEVMTHATSTPANGPGDDLTRINLRPEARVAGRIIARVPGVSVAGRTVFLTAITPDTPESQREETISDGEGRFEFAQLSGTEAGVGLEMRPTGGDWVARPALRIPLEPGQTSGGLIELIAGVVVAGTLLGTDTNPIAGVAVAARFGGVFLGQFTALTTTTDAAGSYRFRLPPGSTEISLNPFVVPYTLVNSTDSRRTIEVPDGVATFTVPPILLAPAARLLGRVVDAAERPIADARVVVQGAQRFVMGNRNSVTTDAAGRFTATRSVDNQILPSQPGYPVKIQLADGREFDADAVPRSGAGEATVKLPILLANSPRGPDQVAHDEIAGVVVDAQGRPLEGVLAHAYSWVPKHKAVSDKEGRFRITNLPEEGKLEVRISAAGYEPREFPRQPTGQAGWVVVLGNRTYFEGRVLAPTGTPVADAPIRADSGMKRLEASIMSHCWTETRSDKQGRYRLYVEPGVYDIQVRVADVGVLRLTKEAIATDEARPLDLTLAPGVNFVARVVDAQTGAPVAGFTIEDWQNPIITGTSDATGLLQIPAMMPGPIMFRWFGKNEGFGRWWSAACLNEWTRFQATARFGFQRNFDGLDFDMRPGMEPVTVQVERAATIRGVVLDPDGKPVAGATVAPALAGSGNSLTGDTRFSVETDKDGAYTMRLPASGAIEYNLIAHDGKYNEPTRTWANGVIPPFRTQPGQVLEGVTLRLTRASTVTGRVVDAAGKPVAGREVRASAVDKRENRYYDPTTKTAADGTFTLRGVRPGEQFIQAAPFWLDAASAPGGSSRTLTLVAGETASGIELTAQPPR